MSEDNCLFFSTWLLNTNEHSNSVPIFYEEDTTADITTKVSTLAPVLHPIPGLMACLILENS